MDGQPVSLADFRGKKLWLAFFRFAACPLCSFRVHELLGKWKNEFAPHGVNLLTFWQSPRPKLEEIKERYAPEFSLIADPDMKLYELYRVETGQFLSKDLLQGLSNARKAGIRIIRTWDGPARRCPADFLIGEDGVIHTAFYGKNVANMIPLDRVTAFLQT